MSDYQDPMDCNLPGSSVHGILQARILKWVAIPFSRASSQPRDQPAGDFFFFFFTTKLPGKPQNLELCLNRDLNRLKVWCLIYRLSYLGPLKYQNKITKLLRKTSWRYINPIPRTQKMYLIFKCVELSKNLKHTIGKALIKSKIVEVATHLSDHKI